MSTRGTYSLAEGNFYNHCDNYPTGAAEIFATYKQNRFKDFLSACPTAEKTDGRDAHEDTNYHYTIIRSGRSVAIRCERRATRHRWDVIFEGSLAAFMAAAEKMG